VTLPPLALDIDGTLTDGNGRVDHRVFTELPEWPAPVVLATGKSFPYPVALCGFLGLPERVIAENGGVTLVDGEVSFAGDPDRVERAVDAFHDRGGDLGWDDADTVNRWRETEVAARLTADGELLRTVAAEFDLELLDTGYAYHLKSPAASKGNGLELVADALGYPPAAFVAVGDSENDAPAFETAGRSVAVANADDTARAAADTVTDDTYFDGTLSVLDRLREEFDAD